MKKNILACLLSACLFLTFSACANERNVNNTVNENTTIENNEEGKNDTNITEGHKKNEEVTKEDTSKEDAVKENTTNDNIIGQELLNEINENAKIGKVVDCDFGAKNGVIDKVINEWGEPESSNYIEEAKGLYFTFKDKDVAFGCNKGSQIFEVRSFSTRLGALSLSDIENYFGKPQYDIISNLNEKIIGYVINDDFKILFVFKDAKNSNPVLDHYSILYTKGTVNMMADDSGREW